ncbi:MAG: hypothetical protein ACYST5_23260, partial [Planctomycetota bacterium]
MGELLIPILIVVLASAVACRLLLVARRSYDGTRAMSVLSRLLPGANSNQSVKDSVRSDPQVFPARPGSAGPRQAKEGGLDCRVQLTKQKKDNCDFDAFDVEICGSIPARRDTDYATLKISIMDITDGAAKTKPVQTRVKQWQIQDSSPQGGGPPIFCYNADLGRLPCQVTTLSDWMSVAQLRVDWLRFARKGK